MIFNGGPSSFGSGGSGYFSPFDPTQHFFIKYNLEDEYEEIKFYEDESALDKTYYELKNQDNDNSNLWYIKFLKNCYIKIEKKLICSLFLVGKGEKGTNGTSNASYGAGTRQGGVGGNGGKIREFSKIELDNKEYEIIIENSDSEIKKDNTSLYSSSTGTVVGNGGPGAKIVCQYNEYSPTDASPGGDGQLKYGIYYGAGGGGGGCQAYYEATWAEHGYAIANASAGLGGGLNQDDSRSGGNGGSGTNGGGGLINTGSGGGGGYSHTHNPTNGGAGSYGTIIISNK